jgi:type I restriction enzyme, S subunit
MPSEALASSETTGWLYHPVFPAHWKRCVLYPLAQWVNGLTFRDIQFSPTGKPVIKIAEIKEGISGQTKFTEQVFDEAVHVKAGDLLFSWSGQPETSIDVFWWRGPDGWLNQHSFRVTPVKSVDRTFFFYLLRYLKPNFVGIARNKQTTGLGHVTKHDLETIEVAYPTLPEQHAIAQILGTLDDKIELNRRMNETLDGIARTLFKSWFVDFDPVRAKGEGRDSGLPKPIADLFPDSFEDSELGKIPKGWKAGIIVDHMTNFDSKRIPVSGAERAKRQGPFPYHGAAGIMDYVDSYLFDGIYLLVGEDGTVMREGGLGVTQYVWGKFWVNNHAHVLQGAGAVSTEQLYLYFHFEPVFPYVTGAVQPKLSQGRMNTMPFVFAGDPTCRAFAEVVKPWFARQRANTDENRTLADLRDTLLPKLISGDIRVKDAERFIERVV